jgi:hypothetical protein
VLTAASRGLPGTANRASVQQLLKELRSTTAATDSTATAASITTAEGWEQRIQSWRLGVHSIQQVHNLINTLNITIGAIASTSAAVLYNFTMHMLSSWLKQT